nr:retrotransposon protein, putative, Ty1-copia subclass [Tanacetum cinerariifolium]
MTPELHIQFENSSAYDMIQELKSMFEKQAGVERFGLIQTFHACKQDEGKPVAVYVLQIKGYVDQLERLGYMLPQDLIVGLILNGLTKDFAGFVRNYNMHNMGKTIGELHAMLIERPIRNRLKLKARVKLMAREMIKTQSLLLKCTQLRMTPATTARSNGIYEIDMHDLVPNVNSIYNVSTKRAKHNFDYTYLWNCRLDHISKKRIEKLQQEGLLRSTDDESFDQSVSCLSGKMTRKSFPHRLERATDLFEIVHNDVCGPLRHVSRQGASYFSTFTDDYSLFARYAEFFEKNLITQKVSGRAVDLEEIQDEDTSPYEITSEIPMEVEGFELPQEEVILIRRSERTHQAPDHLCLNVEVEEHSMGDLNEPVSYKAAMLDSESNKWIDVVNAEIQSMIDNMVWVLVDLPPNCMTVGSKWIFKKNTDMDGIAHTYKACLVAKGYTQLYEADYKETFSPVADVRAIRILISIAAFYDYEIWQMDLQRSIYGLKQASRSWNKRFDEEMKRFGFAQKLDEPCVYQKASESNVIFLILYVDDINIMGNHIPSLQNVKDYLGKCFAMKDLGKATFILGIKIYRDRSKQLIGLGQNAYMDKILKRYKMDNSKRGHIPMQERLDLNKTQRALTPKEVKRMQNVPYALAVGSIMQFCDSDLEVAFRQHTCFIRNLEGVNLLSRYQGNNLYTLSLGDMMASVDNTSGPVPQRKESSGLALHEMTPATISLGLMPNLTSSTPFVPPSRTNWDMLFQPLFDELLTLSPSVDHPSLEVIALISKVVALEPAASTNSPSSATVDQDAPSPSNSQTTPGTQSSIIPNDVEDDNHDLDVAHMKNDPFFSILILEVLSDQSSSTDIIHTIVHPDHQISEPNSKWTKDHPLENIIGQLARLVSTRLQSHEQALFCYYNSFLTFVKPMTCKDALTKSCWIETAFLNGNLREEVYVNQLDGFVDPDNPNHVYKLKKAIYGLKQAPRVWYDMLSSFLISQDFSKGSVEPTMFIHRDGKELLLVQIYVDDIIFAVSTPELYDLFAKIMCLKFKMSMMAKISFFLGLQISQSPRGIFVNQSKYALESLKKYGFESCDLVDTLTVEKFKLDEDKKRKAIDLSHYRGMIGTLLYLTASRPDLQFAICKYARQKSDAISSKEAEYIALSGRCAQIFWMRSQLTTALDLTRFQCTVITKALLTYAAIMSNIPGQSISTSDITLSRIMLRMG